MVIKKILVTGSLGQLGSYVCESLMDDGVDVIGLDNRVNICLNLPKRVDNITVNGDVCDKAVVNKVLNGIDAVVHCAAQVGVEESVNSPTYDAESNVIGTIVLLQAADNSSVKRFVYISSAAIYGDPVGLPINEDHPQNPLSPYGLSKLTAGKYVDMFWQIHGLAAVVIRPFNIYSKRVDPRSPYSGVINRFIERVKENKPPIIEGDGNQTRDFIHVKDVVQMIRLTLEKKESVGEAFNCGCGKPTTINQLSDLIIRISGRNLNPVCKSERIGGIGHSYADIKKAKKILGFKPKIDLEEGLEEMINSAE